MGAEQRQGGLNGLVLFLDENHCRNPHILRAIQEHGATCEKHLDHFPPGTPDTVWLPFVGSKGWSLLTSDARIRRNMVEREALRTNSVRMFYFSRNQLSGSEMGEALRRALPQIGRIVRKYTPPFTASISRNGDVTVRDTFD